MKEAIVYISAALFLINVFPVHVFNYIYINTEEKYASINVTVFRFIRLFNINTVKENPKEIQFNGKNKQMTFETLKTNMYKVFNQLCIFKVIQLSDFGLKEQDNAYAALLQNGLTTTAYKFLQMNGNATKLRNYTVFNEEHSSIRYYAKVVTVINILVVTKILLILLTEKINELKNQKKQRQRI